MVSIDMTIGVWEEDIARVMKWYSLAFKDKHPSKEDEECYMLFKLLHKDLKRENEAEKDE